MLGRSPSILSIDIGSSQLKMVSIESGRSRPRLAAAGVEPMQPDAIVGGEVMDYHLVVQSLQALRERLGVKAKAAATAVSGRDVIVKRIKMDRMREEEARQVIRWEAEQHVPFDIGSVSLDFDILDPDEDGLQMEVLLVAAKTDLVESRMELLQEAGFETAVIDLDAFAAQTAFEQNYEHATYGTFCLVNVGREITNLNLIEIGRPLLTRDIAVGERKFAEALVKELDIPLEEAEGILRNGSDMEPEARSALDKEIDNLVTPIERAQAFLASKEAAGESHLDEIVLSGGGALNPCISEAISDRMETAVTIMDPLRGLEVTPGARAGLAEIASPAMLAVAVGLGLRERK